ncbi:MAG: TetR/AcrR family transcriptional regulator [Clostridia bacterium]
MKKTTRVNSTTQKNYKKLYTALTELMEKNDLDNISVVDICTKAGTPRATFYNHFEDKYDLLRYFFNSKISGLLKELREKNLKGKELIDDMIYEILLFISKNAVLLEKMLRNDSSIGIYEIEKIINNVLYINFKNLQSEFEFLLPIEPLASFYAGALVFTGKWWLDNNQALTYEEATVFLKKMIDVNIYTIKKKMK